MMNKYKFFLALFLFAVLCPPQNVFGNIDLPESAEEAAAMLTLSEEDEPVRAWATGESTEYRDDDGNTYTLPMYTDGMVTYIVKDPRGDEAVVVGMYKDSEYRYNMNAVIPPIINIYGRDYDVTSIGGYAFTAWYNDELWGLTSITIPYSVTYVSGSAFSSCTGLTYIKVDSRNPVYDSRDNCNAIIETSTNTLICGCKNSTIPKSVTSIGSYAFYDCKSLTNINIPDSVTIIGEWAFHGCTGLTSVTIGNSVTSIGDYTFHACRNLLNIDFGNSTPSYGGRFDAKETVFEGTAWYENQPEGVVYTGLVAYRTKGTVPENVIIKEGTKKIHEGLFWSCNTLLRSITIPNSVTSIEDYAFSFCTGLTSVNISDLAAWCNISFTDCESNPLRYAHHLYLNGQEVIELNIPNSVTSIGNYAFYGCTGLTSVSIPNSVTNIGESAFWDCTGLASITIPNSVTSIKKRTFEGCIGLTSIIIPNSVTSIGEKTFSGCTGLTSITIGNSVTSIESNAFEYCTGLTSVNISDLAAWCNISFSTYWGFESNPLYYAHHLYLNGEEVIELSIPNSVTSIEDGAFYGCTGLTSITIPNSVTSIGSSAFSGCTGLTSITIPNTVGYIGYDAFKDTPWYSNWYNNLPDGLIYMGLVAYKYKGYMPENTCIVIKEGTKSIGMYAFEDCSGLTSVTIPNSVTSIGDWAFLGCTGLTSIIIPNSATRIGNGAFYGCSSLKSVIIPNSVSSIGELAFSDCTGLTSITIPNSVSSIGEWAFQNCTGLTSITIGNSANRMDHTFAGCSNLTNINALRMDPKNYNCFGTFNKDTYIKARLHVPIGYRSAYATTDPWSGFENIIDDIELTGIEDVIADSNTEAHKQITDYYNLQGQRTTRLQRGVNIIRYSDDTTKKVLVK